MNFRAISRTPANIGNGEFCHIVTVPKLVNIAAKRSILNLCGSLGYASGIIIHNSKVNTKTNSKMKVF